MNTTEQEQETTYDEAFDDLVNPQNGEAEEESESEVGPGVNDELTTEADAEEAETQEAEEADDQDVEDQGSGDADEDDLDTLKKERDHYKHGFDANRGRVSAYQKKINDLEAKLAEASQKPNGDAESNTDTDNPEGSGMTDEEWATFAEEYPEMARAFETRLSKLDETINARIGEIEHQVSPLADKAHEEQINAQISILESKHPDWQQVTSSEEFTKWISEQPKPVQDLAGSMDAGDASYLIDTFKAVNGNVQDKHSSHKRQDRLRQSVNIKTKGGGRRQGGVPDDYDAAFDHFAGQSN